MPLNKSIEEEAKDIKPDIKPRTALRGKTAALLANLSSSDSESDLIANNKLKSISTQPVKKGIYSQVINHTKQNIKATHTRLDKVDKQLDQIIGNDKENNSSIEKKTLKKKQSNASNSSFESSESEESSVKSDSSSGSTSSSPVLNHFKNSKKNKPEKERSPSPPPPPSLAAKKKRKSTALVDKQLKELEKIKSFQQDNTVNISVHDIENDLEDEVFNLITVRVSMKNGVQKFDIKKNEPFLKIYEQISRMEETGIENLVLMLEDKKIDYKATPHSIDLQVYDIIELNKIVGKKMERIQIIEKETETDSPDKAIITFQTSEGRKSRLTFKIFKDEPLKNVLKIYCEKKELGDYTGYMMEFDGESVDPDDIPDDLDLDGGDIFDVKKCSKSGASLDVVNSNKNNYAFDDDILIA